MSVSTVKLFVLDVLPLIELLISMSPRAVVIVLLLVLFTTIPLVAETISNAFQVDINHLTTSEVRKSLSQNMKGYKIGIALSGGGARGLAQIGVLSELEKEGIEIDIVSGTSIGGIIGGLYAMGMTPEEIEQEIGSIDWSSFFSDKPKRESLLLSRRAETEGELLALRFDGLNPHIPTALTSGQKLLNMLNSLTHRPDYLSKGGFVNLERQLAIVATDIVSGKKVVFTSGSMVTAMRATSGVPLAFTPLEKEEMLLMDGGLLDPIPTDEARNLGADFVIAVNTTSGLLSKDEINNPVDIANQTTTILSTPAQQRLLAQADFVITPDLGRMKATDFGIGIQTIPHGREAVDSSIDELKECLLRLTDTCQTVLIDSVEIICQEGDFQHQTLQEMTTELKALSPRKLTTGDLNRTVYEIFKSGFFTSIQYNLKSEECGNVLKITCNSLPPIQQILIIGNEVFSDSTLFEVSLFNTIQVKSLQQITACYNRIIKHYHTHGYDLARIAGAVLDTMSGTLNIKLHEGKISGIEVEGNEKTRHWVIKSYFPLRTGQPYSKFQAERGVRQIYASGLFENVSLQLSEKMGGVWIKIIIKERKFTYAKIGARYHEEFHPESFLKLGYANIGGTGNELSVYGRFSERRKKFQVQLRADRIFRTMVTYNVRFYYSNDKIGTFEGDHFIGHRTFKRWGTRIGIGPQLARLGLIDIAARYEHIRYTTTTGQQPIDRILTSLQANIRYDTKDHYPFPTSGRGSELLLEVASDIAGSQEVFKKFEGYLEIYQKIGSIFNLHPRVALGLSDKGLPEYERFYLGGTRSFIGYRTDQLIGDKYFLVNFEFRLGPIYNFYFSSRYDMGDVFDVLEQFRTDHLRHSFGFILALDTPLGPFSFGYGRAEGKYDNLYLNIGYDF